MNGDPLRYSPHATDKMRSDGIFEEDVEGTVDWPIRRGWSYNHRIAHFGYTSNGRLINVVTDASETYVYTVIDVEARRRERALTRRRKKSKRYEKPD
jgi:hypothetical protein